MCPTAHRPTSGDLRSAFHVIDADKDGLISKDDLRSIDLGLSDETIGTMMDLADRNRDGFVEYDEFERVFEEEDSREKRRDMIMMEEVFRVMDRDGDGLVGPDDLKGYFEWAGLEARDEDIKAMMRLGGGGEARGVSFDGLLKILAL